MRVIFAVFLLCIAYVASYPALQDSENDFELELRSILNQLQDEQMTRSLTTEEDDDDDEYEFSKRQGGLNKVDKQSECEIKCIYAERNPGRGKGKTVKEAAKICKNKCPASNKRGQKKTIVQRKGQPGHKMSLREFFDNDDSNSNSNEDEQQVQRRELYNYLMEQLDE